MSYRRCILIVGHAWFKLPVLDTLLLLQLVSILVVVVVLLLLVVPELVLVVPSGSGSRANGRIYVRKIGLNVQDVKVRLVRKSIYMAMRPFL